LIERHLTPFSADLTSQFPLYLPHFTFMREKNNYFETNFKKQIGLNKCSQSSQCQTSASLLVFNKDMEQEKWEAEARKGEKSWKAINILSVFFRRRKLCILLLSNHW